MLEELRIRGLGVIDDAELGFSEGFTVVTGETGAGKTMVVTALNLLLGARADASLVRAGADKAVVEGRVRVPVNGPVSARAADAGEDLDDGTLLLGRVISPEGRSRAQLGGRSVPATVLADVGNDLVVVHGQGDQRRLLRSPDQRAALDRFQNRLTSELVRLDGPEAAHVAMVASGIGRAIDRIGDHAAIIGARLRYLLTGDPDHLAAEVR